MPDGVSPPFAWTLQPAGATFDPPIQIEYPNMTGLPAGAVSYFLSFNHDTNRFDIVASGTVTADGSTIISDPGSGLTVAGWGCNCPPYSVTGDCEGPPDIAPASPPPIPPGCPGKGGGAPPSPLICDACPRGGGFSPSGSGSGGIGPAAGAGGPPATGPASASAASGAGDADGMILIYNGEEQYQTTDLMIPGRGIDWVQKRVYLQPSRLKFTHGS